MQRQNGITMRHDAKRSHETYKETSINLVARAEWKDPPGRSSETVIAQSSQDAQIGYQRILPHAAQHRYTLDLMCRRCSRRAFRPREERKRKYLRVLRLYRISRLWHEVFIKSSPDPKPNPICASIHPGYRTTTSDPFLIYADASSKRGFVYSTDYRLIAHVFAFS